MKPTEVLVYETLWFDGELIRKDGLSAEGFEAAQSAESQVGR